MSKRREKRRAPGSVYLDRPAYVDRSGVLKEARTWSASFVDHRGMRRRLGLGVTDKTAAQELARTIERLIGSAKSSAGVDGDLAARIRAMTPKLRTRLAEIGLVPHAQAALSLKLADLLGEYKTSQLEHVSTKQAEQVVSRCRRVFNIAGCVLWADISTVAVERALRTLRESGDPAQRRAATKTKPAVQPKPISARSRNFMLTAARGFTRWCVERGLAESDPLRPLRRLKLSDSDATFTRRALSADDARRIMEAAAAGPTIQGVDGPTRALAWRLMLEAGLRKNEVARLTVADLNLRDRNKATLTVRARKNSKNKRTETLPLRRSLADALAARVTLKTPSALVFGMGAWWRAAEALTVDLASAGVAAETEAGVVDAHALRHTFATWLAEAPERIVTALMRHTPDTLAGRTYQHVDVESLRAWLKLLPDLTAPVGADAATQRKAAGAEMLDPVLRAVLRRLLASDRTRLHSETAFSGSEWRTRQDSNLQPSVPKTDAAQPSEYAESAENPECFDDSGRVLAERLACCLADDGPEVADSIATLLEAAGALNGSALARLLDTGSVAK
jgi:integrase